MANATDSTSKWVVNYDTIESGTKTFNFETKDTFADKDLEINITTPKGSFGIESASVQGTSNVGILDVATSSRPSTGAYVKVQGAGTVNVASAGWFDENDSQTAAASDVYYPLISATFTVNGPNVKSVTEGYVAANETVGIVANGAQTITGGELSTTDTTTSLASNGLSNGTTPDSSKKIALSTVQAANCYELETSGTATVARAIVTKQVTSAGYFSQDSSPVTVIAAGTENVSNAHTKYYVAQSTLSASTITSSNVQQTVTISAGYYHDARIVTINAMASATVSPNTANSGLSTYFNSGTSQDYSVSITPRYSVTGAGYVGIQTNTAGTPAYYKIKTTSMSYGTSQVLGESVARAIASWGTGWITEGEISYASFASAGTSGKTYVDISETREAPVLVAGDYLYINRGYTDDLKISLAHLVPNGSDVKGHAEYILAGHSAYDNDGVLVSGSIPTYDGSYTIT